jgi:HSP20 family protein
LAIDLIDELARELWDLRRESLVPLARILDTENTVIVEVDLPLVKKKDIQLKFVEGGIEVEASLTRCVQFERWGTVQRSCEFKSFYKVIPLPSYVVAEGAKASFKRGILRIELNKRKAFEDRIPIE